MLTRAPSVTSCVDDCFLALDHADEVGGARSHRFHHGARSSSNHHPGEPQELRRPLQNTQPTTKPESALDFHTLVCSPTSTIHHDPPKPPGSLKRLPSPTTRGGSFPSLQSCKPSPMSSPEPARVAVVVLARVRQPEPPPVAKTRKRVTRAGCCVRTDAVPELDDMQTPIANAHTPAAATASAPSDQEVPEVVLLSSPSKRRRLEYDHAPEHLNPTPSDLALGPEGCEDSGLTAERHMADLDRTSKSSTPEDIDSATAAAEAAAVLGATSQLAAQSQCSTPPTEQVVEQEQVVVQVPMPREPLQILEHLHFVSSRPPNVVVVVDARDRTSPSDDDIAQYSTSRLLPPTGHIRVPHSRISTHSTKTMATGGGDEWLQLSLGSHGPADEAEPPATVPLDSYQQQQQAQSPPTQNPPGISLTPDPPGIRDFFKSQETVASSSSHRFTPASPYRPTTSESSRQQHYYSSEPGSHHPRAGSSPSLPRPLFLEQPQPRASRDSGWLDPTAHTPRVPPGDHYTLPVSQKGSFRPQQFATVPALPYYPARILQPVRSDPTDTTAVHARRSSHEAGPSSGPQYPSAAPWMQQQHSLQPNLAEPFLSMGATPGPSFRDWRSGPSSAPFLNVQLPVTQGVDAEQAWRNLLQRVGNNMAGPGASTSSSAGARPPEPMMMPPGEREEYLDALKRAVERFQGADQGGREELQIPELQRLQRSAGAAAMIPPGHPHQRPHSGLHFDPTTEMSLARTVYRPPLGSGGKARVPGPAAPAAAPAPSPESRQRRILRPHTPKPGLWFTLQASASQPERPEASPLQQIPTAHIRVVDDTMTVAAVRGYLANKLGLASEDEVELTCRGKPLQPGTPLHQVRDGIWQSPNTNTPNINTPQMLSAGKAWKAPDGSITLVENVVMVLTYGRRPPQQQASSPASSPAPSPAPAPTSS